MVVKQYDVFLVCLDPTVDHEIKKSRPCIVLSPDEMNKYISTVIIAPMTTKSRSYPTRIHITFQKKKGWVVLDQIRTIDKQRLIKRLGEKLKPCDPDISHKRQLNDKRFRCIFFGKP